MCVEMGVDLLNKTLPSYPEHSDERMKLATSIMNRLVASDLLQQKNSNDYFKMCLDIEADINRLADDSAHGGTVTALELAIIQQNSDRLIELAMENKGRKEKQMSVYLDCISQLLEH